MANSQHEPTMEEILASIRKIIAEDPPGGEAANTSPPKEDEPDVLDLTHEVHEESVTVTSVTAPEPVAESSSEAPAANGSAAAVSSSGEGIFSEKARKALNDAFADLDAATSESGNEQVPSMSGLSIEAVFEKAVRETYDPVMRKWLDDNTGTLIERMKPVISEWLDTHFPAMLEDAVRNEVARVVMARGRR
jgi:uncharacterized protein